MAERSKHIDGIGSLAVGADASPLNQGGEAKEAMSVKGKVSSNLLALDELKKLSHDTLSGKSHILGQEGEQGSNLDLGGNLSIKNPLLDKEHIRNGSTHQDSVKEDILEDGLLLWRGSKRLKLEPH